MAAKPGTKTRGEDEEVARRRLFKATRLCKFFLAGCCSRGETCNFAHSVDDLKQFPDFSKTRLCEPFMKSGTCEQGVNCKFAHSRDELRPSYISSAKSKRAATGAASSQVPQEPVQVPATAGQEGEQPASQLQSLMPATKVVREDREDREDKDQQDREQDLDRQSTEVVDEDGRRFSRQTTEDPGYSRQTTAFSRQTTEEPSYTVGSRQAPEEPRRPLPLSELLSLPEPGPGETESSQQPSRAVSRGSSEYEARERSEELNVRLKNTFLHFETAQTSDASAKVKARPSSLPPNFLGRGPGMNGRHFCLTRFFLLDRQFDIAAMRRIAVLSAHATASEPYRSDKCDVEGVRLPWRRFPARQPSAPSFRTVGYQVQDGVAIITRNRPEVLNAVNFQVHCDMIAAFEEAENDESVLCAVLTGAGRYFCSGADVTGRKATYSAADPPRVQQIKAVLSQYDPFDANTWSDVNMYDAWINFSKPLVIAVNGPAIGEGFTTLMLGDVIYAADSAFFWAPFARFGVVPEITSSLTLAQRVGPMIASEMVLFSKKKTPEEMHRCGLVNEILPAGDKFLPSVLERVRSGLELSGAPQIRLKALRMIKGLIKNKAWREQMMAQNRQEQEMIRTRLRDGDQSANLKYYQAQMPKKK
ncbi:Enoyl-CoA delta isomerase 2, mitochondrial [Symbiodinium microadriaticum]|uniref:Enoyl-CoA delta isomerase 2, mitochondrial n=1 Tax=Symbiodinium microadriaticum TaxID=2951 RepID=A0A1Q9CS29_SYMMI|nr:Enoyl-CoA delta isomerase 2, mitochondrial [Symbiodinium microadriaticum]